MWVYARTGRTSFSGNIVFAVFSMIAFFSSSYIAYSHYKCNHYSMTVLQSELKSIEVTQPNLYDKAAADSLLTSYAKCYESGHVGQTNSKNIMGCPRQYFLKNIFQMLFTQKIELSQTRIKTMKKVAVSGFGLPVLWFCF